MNLQEAKHHPLVEYARENLWGSGTATIPEQFEEQFLALSEDDQRLVRTFFTAATVSCPVPLSLAEDPRYGPGYLEVRYTSVDFWYRYLKEGIFKNTSFGAPVDLTHLGGRGSRYDNDWIPVGRESGLVGPSTYEGHILPRLIIDILNFSQKYELNVAEQTFRALDIVINTANDPLGTIASLALYMKEIGFGVEPLKERLFDEGYQQETPKRYWYLKFDQLNSMLPEELRYGG